MKLLYTHENPVLVGNARNIVENSGIEVFMKNEFVSGGIGELSPLDTWPELWVANDTDFDRAKKLLQVAFDQADTREWRCTHCGELNDASFDFCWKCQHGRA